MRDMNDPAATERWLDGLYFGLGKNVSPASLCQRQVVHVQRILCANVAAGDAISAVNAFLFDDTLAVCLVDRDSLLLEVDRERKGFDQLPQLRSTFLQGLKFFQTAARGMRRHIKSLFRTLVIIPERARLGFANLRRLANPTRPGCKNIWFRPDGHVRIDERSAPQAASLDHHDVGEGIELVQAQPIEDWIEGIGRNTGQAVRELP